MYYGPIYIVDYNAIYRGEYRTITKLFINLCNCIPAFPLLIVNE